MTEMTTEEFDKRRSKLSSQYEQGLANLYRESGWSQDKIANHEGISQTYVSYLLTFGEFLEWSKDITNCDMFELTEGKFRRAWEQSGHLRKEERFQYTLDMLEGRVKPPIKKETTVANDNQRKRTIEDLMAKNREKYLNTDPKEKDSRTAEIAKYTMRRIEDEVRNITGTIYVMDAGTRLEVLTAAKAAVVSLNTLVSQLQRKTNGHDGRQTGSMREGS